MDKYQEFKALLDAGDKASASKDFSEAKRNFTEALKLAEQGHWINEIAAVQTSLAEVSMLERNFEEAEAGFNDAISFCEREHECDMHQMEVGVGYLNFLYLYELKDVQKSADLVNRIKNSNKCAAAGCATYVCKHIKEMASAGYDAEANQLAAKENCRF